MSPLAGRTYPLEGTAVLFPQHAPYTDPLTVLVCGGSNFGIAVDNCVHIQPEVEGAEWVLERMVTPIIAMVDKQSTDTVHSSRLNVSCQPW